MHIALSYDRSPGAVLRWRIGAMLQQQLLRLSVPPVLDVFAHQILGQAVALLDPSFQLIAAAVDLSKIIVGQLTPLLFDLAFCFLPVPLDPVPSPTVFTVEHG